MVESVRAYSFWPVPHGERPTDSHIDSHNLLIDHFYFIASTRMCINQNLYDLNMPKYPLIATKSLEFVGKSSFLLKTSIKHPDVDKSYADCYVQTVLVDPKTRKPSPLPDWWREKYVKHVQNNPQLKLEPLLEPNENTFSFPVMVNSRDVDSYKHANWSSYIRFCDDACAMHTHLGNYKKVDNDRINCGLREFQISFKKESLLGDQLHVKSWEDLEKSGCVNFKVKNGSDVLAEVKMEYFNDIKDQIEGRSKL